MTPGRGHRADRVGGEPHGIQPPTPPYVPVRIQRFRIGIGEPRLTPHPVTILSGCSIFSSIDRFVFLGPWLWPKLPSHTPHDVAVVLACRFPLLGSGTNFHCQIPSHPRNTPNVFGRRPMLEHPIPDKMQNARCNNSKSVNRHRGTDDN